MTRGSEGAPQTFEEAMARIEVLVREMETGSVALEELIQKYEEGMRLLKFCRDKLAQAEQKIEILTRSVEEGGRGAGSPEG
ncbi:exodeoxyribonuclease VII small subunit [Candidatus Methylacidithermus pantelleriae]|uniref:Exodeoxyribonuclease 7 small subunit n=1 Tax=Candidatus Methylacidithermus pantelleriae TaxID=2744239 RepID=A0A8J2BTZ4_9BACT|nr:exodeoxyribonuclease VII small subunit [Candidatus Methylacidithermus pantelleriae]CAF0698921.1 Exodeoxyribonuclease VII small subunit [Candidatus Methylacidithermus pantelleriae]